MADTARRDREIEVWTELLANGRVDWTIRIDGEDHGGGTTHSHTQALQDAANYFRDRAVIAFEKDAERRLAEERS